MASTVVYATIVCHLPLADLYSFFISVYVYVLECKENCQRASLSESTGMASEFKRLKYVTVVRVESSKVGSNQYPISSCLVTGRYIPCFRPTGNKTFIQMLSTDRGPHQCLRLRLRLTLPYDKIKITPCDNLSILISLPLWVPFIYFY